MKTLREKFYKGRAAILCTVHQKRNLMRYGLWARYLLNTFNKFILFKHNEIDFKIFMGKRTYFLLNMVKIFFMICSKGQKIIFACIERGNWKLFKVLFIFSYALLFHYAKLKKQCSKRIPFTNTGLHKT